MIDLLVYQDVSSAELSQLGVSFSENWHDLLDTQDKSKEKQRQQGHGRIDSRADQFEIQTANSDGAQVCWVMSSCDQQARLP
eukprot:CAMPEP_0197623800 /NCGR_PEP_ID=MMETSP1338-20131121/3725_1 /TAXON_ID=43686 ORGANISM="Pelagodinium beii, Strain RCC1491" /NCGR_SAMPLE_ID=MMETSP1338 /ASSEMBLY_ACC=CAM_ASM_000754 /LENGTH=81 /DNA_ID=CAMNT_0043193877 /DNA_START=198 /DNA_END=443 /DNA_ORIENTATION=-